MGPPLPPHYALELTADQGIGCRARHRITLAMAAFLLTGCAEVALVKSFKNSSDLAELRDRQQINLWKDESAVEARTKYFMQSKSDGAYTPLAIVAPAWSHGGVSVRVASPITGKMVYQPELQVAALTDSGVALELFVNGDKACLSGVFNDKTSRDSFTDDWQRLPLTEAMLAAAKSDGMLVRLECEVGSWTFRLPPAYFRGYETKLTELVQKPFTFQVSQEHQPSVGGGRAAIGP